MIKIQKKMRPPEALLRYERVNNASYNGMHGVSSHLIVNKDGSAENTDDKSVPDVYTVVLNSLKDEQNNLCAYCMCDISAEDSNSTIEHIIPQSVDQASCIL